MTKLTLTTVADLEHENTAVAVLNANFATIVSAFDNTFSRDGTLPNQIGSNIDVNSKRIINLPNPITATEPLRLQDLASFIGGSIVTFPSGGTTGQVLVKNSNTNYDVSWSASGSGSGSVSSVALSLPADFTVSGSPVTSTGTLTASFANTPTGSGGFVRQTSPTLITPVLGVATATTINKYQFIAPATGASLTIADAKGITFNNGLTFAGTDGTILTFQATDTYVGRATTDTLTNKTLTSPVLVTPALGAATGTSLALNGATLGGNALSVTGTILTSGPIGIGPLASDGSGIYIRATISTDGVGGIKSAATWTGTRTNIAGIFIEPTFSSATVTTFYGLSINGPSYASSSCVNFYSLRIGLPTGGSSITQAIYTEGAGTIGFGTSNAQAHLHLNDNAAATIPPAGTTFYLSGPDNGFSQQTFDSYGASGLSQLTFRRTRGTGASPNSTVLAGDTLMNIVAEGNDGSGYTFATAGITAIVTANYTTGPSHPTALTFSTTAVNGNFAAEAGRFTPAGGLTVGGISATDPGNGGILAAASIKSQSASAGIGYATGAGSTVTQGTSRATAVTVNTPSGQITMFTAAGSATASNFTVNCSSCAANDVVILNVKSGSANFYVLQILQVSAGSFVVQFQTTGGTASDTPVIQYVIIKGVIS